MFGALLTTGLLLAQVAQTTQPEPQRQFLLGTSRLEIAIVPAQVQLSLATQHVGTKVALGWHLNDRFAVQLSGFYNYVAEHSKFESPNRILRLEPDARPSLNVWGTLAGVELAPLRGVSNVGRLSLVLGGGIGLGGTRRELRPANDAGPATFADTGLRFLASLGGGFRLEVTKHVVLRLEAHDLIFSDRVQTVNGCNEGDLRSMDQALRNGMRPSSATTSGGCQTSTFEGNDPKTGLRREDNVPLANNLVKPPNNAQLVHNVTVQLGAAVQF